MKKIKFLITGGGTGGHLFPAIAAAENLSERYSEAKVLFVGTHRKIDKASLEKYGFSLKSIFCLGLKGKNVLQLLKAVLILPISLLQSLFILFQFKPDLVLGVGGYVTGPVIVAARLCGIPTVIHEQNSIPGLANRKLGSIVSKICLSIPGSENFFAKDKCIHTGNPVRKEIIDLGANKEEGNDHFTLLILGGSQGAHRINELIVEIIEKYRHLLPVNLRIVHQTGINDEKFVNNAYKKQKIKASAHSFISKMTDAYQDADLVISRAGATTLAELAVLGIPAILIPYPYAADNHQQLNAQHYARAGGAMLVKENSLNAEKLALIIGEISVDKKKLSDMSASMKERGVSEAAKNIIDVCSGELLKS